MTKVQITTPHYLRGRHRLTLTELAQARHHGYALFGRLFRDGVTAVLLPYVQAIPELAAALLDSPDFDEAAAEHYQLFGFNLFPYESIFLDGAGLLGGTVTEQVAARYRQIGYVADTAVASPDHISQELGALAHLCQAEADAWEDDRPHVARQMQARQRTFLGEHLLRWLPPFILAVRQRERPFYTALADLTLALIAQHAADLSGFENPSPLPDTPAPFDDERASLKEIAVHLTTPPHSGVYLSRDDVARLARRFDLPRGFGGRVQMLTNTLRTAVQYDALPDLLDGLVEWLTGWEEGYGRLTDSHPSLAPFALAWQRRAQHGVCVVFPPKRYIPDR